MQQRAIPIIRWVWSLLTIGTCPSGSTVAFVILLCGFRAGANPSLLSSRRVTVKFSSLVFAPISVLFSMLKNPKATGDKSIRMTKHEGGIILNTDDKRT